MREWLLDYLCCPVTRQRLSPQDVVWGGDGIESGKLVTSDGLAAYPIIRGVPRLIPGIRDENDLRRVYADSFGHQWNTFQWQRSRDEQEFFSISHQTPKSLRGMTVLDGGCGGGRVSRVMGMYCRRLIGLDYSVAVDRAREHTRDLSNCEFVQGDVLQPPLMRERFNFVWSHGVLHHTPSTGAGFDQLARLVAPGGDLHIVVFLKTAWPLRATDGALRALIRCLPYGAATRVCRAMGGLRRIPGARFWKRFVWFSVQPTEELRTYCNFDWYMPRYHHEHSWPEVEGWFRNAGFTEVRYIDGWPDAPEAQKRTPPGWTRAWRLGQLLGVVGHRPVKGFLADKSHARRTLPAAKPAYSASHALASDGVGVAQTGSSSSSAQPPKVVVISSVRERVVAENDEIAAVRKRIEQDKAANDTPRGAAPAADARTCVILQPGYLPWLGFFEQMQQADEFVLLDDVQYDKHGWRNRNRIKGPSGAQWLTVPVRVSGLGKPLINEIELDETQGRWTDRHLHALRTCYGPCRWFDWIYPDIEATLRRPWERLVDLDVALIEMLCDKLGLNRPMRRSSEFAVPAGRCERLVEICRRVNCNRYYSGAAAKEYLDVSLFERSGIEVAFQDYTHPIYPQRFGEFISHLSIVDLMANCGPTSCNILAPVQGAPSAASA